MKKNKSIIGSLLCSGLLFTACQKLPPTGNLSSNFVVFTSHDSSVDFSSYKTFVLSDTISVCAYNPIEYSWYDSNAQRIITEVSAEMKAAGYTQLQASEGSSADLSLKLVGILNVNYYYQAPGYWWRYPNYPTVYYWGNEDGYPNWNPYPYYPVSTGSLILEMADLKNVNKNKSLEVVWSAMGSGLLGYDRSFIASQCVNSVNQAFLQSPYLKSN